MFKPPVEQAVALPHRMKMGGAEAPPILQYCSRSNLLVKQVLRLLRGAFESTRIENQSEVAFGDPITRGTSSQRVDECERMAPLELCLGDDIPDEPSGATIKAGRATANGQRRTVDGSSTTAEDVSQDTAGRNRVRPGSLRWYRLIPVIPELHCARLGGPMESE